MVESVVTKPAEMCLRLQSVYRWCVTGTPVQRNLSGMTNTYTIILSITYLAARSKIQKSRPQTLSNSRMHEKFEIEGTENFLAHS